MDDTDLEFLAMQKMYSAMQPLDDDARSRVLAYVASRFSIMAASSPTSPAISRLGEAATVDSQSSAEFEEFGELFDAFDPKSDVERALVAAYWSVTQGGDGSFDSQALNTMLKNLGHGVTNITRALGGLSGQKPALVIQTRKSGSTKQARKTYKITRSGVNYVRSRLASSEA